MWKPIIEWTECCFDCFIDANCSWIIKKKTIFFLHVIFNMECLETDDCPLTDLQKEECILWCTTKFPNLSNFADWLRGGREEMVPCEWQMCMPAAHASGAAHVHVPATHTNGVVCPCLLAAAASGNTHVCSPTTSAVWFQMAQGPVYEPRPGIGDLWCRRYVTTS